jgi:Uri superfamily endonuclease
MKGIYVLIITVARNISVKVGALGMVEFKHGLYAYVGSAQNNLNKRLERHQRLEKKKFWHIDYLLANRQAKIVKIFHKKATRSEECRLSAQLSKNGRSIVGFGSSDCNCRSHLFKIQGYEFLKEDMTETVLGFS